MARRRRGFRSGRDDRRTRRVRCRRDRQSQQSRRPLRRSRRDPRAPSRHCAARRACWSSTRRSWTSVRGRASYRLCRQRARSCCALSAKPMDSPGCGLGSRSLRPILPRRLRAALGPWPVSGAAIAIGRAALADTAWLDRMRLRLAREAARLDRMLREAGAEIIGGTPLFRLVRHEQAQHLFTDLLKEAILTRPFAAFPDRLRFGQPPGPQAWRRLRAALSGRRR